MFERNVQCCVEAVACRNCSAQRGDENGAQHALATMRQRHVARGERCGQGGKTRADPAVQVRANLCAYPIVVVVVGAVGQVEAGLDIVQSIEICDMIERIDVEP